jgi:hypothetical protein
MHVYTLADLVMIIICLQTGTLALSQRLGQATPYQSLLQVPVDNGCQVTLNLHPGALECPKTLSDTC